MHTASGTRSLGLVVAAVLLSTSFSPAAEEPLTPRSISEAIRSALDDIHSIHIKYNVKSNVVDGDDASDAYSFGLWRDREDYAFSGAGERRKLYRLQKWWEPTHPKDIRPKAWRQSWLAYDGEDCQSVYIESKDGKKARNVSADVELKAPILPIEGGNIYLEGIGSLFYDGEALDVWRRCALDKRAATPSRPFSVPSALLQDGYRLREGTETVEGIPCIVVDQAGQDRMWLDPSKNFSLVRREWHWPDRGPVMFRWINSAFKEITPKFWLPMAMRREVMTNPRHGANAAKKVLLANVCTVLDITANKVPDSLFRVTFSPGTWVVDNTKLRDRADAPASVNYLVGGTPEATEASLRHALDSRTRNGGATESSSYRRAIIIAANIALAVGFVSYLMWRSSKKEVKPFTN